MWSKVLAYSLVSLLAATLLFFAVAAYYYLVIDARPPVYERYGFPTPIAAAAKDRTSLVGKPTAHAGEALLLYKEICWTRKITGKLSRRIEGPMVYVLPERDTADLPLGCTNATGPFEIPVWFIPGKYTIYYTAVFRRPLVEIRVPYGNVAVEIVP